MVGPMLHANTVQLTVWTGAYMVIQIIAEVLCFATISGAVNHTVCEWVRDNSPLPVVTCKTPFTLNEPSGMIIL